MSSLSIPDHIPALARDVEAEVSKLIAPELPRLNARRGGWIAVCWLVNQIAAAVVLTMVVVMGLIMVGQRDVVTEGLKCCIQTVASLVATIGAVSMFRMSFENMREYKCVVGERAVTFRVIALAALLGFFLHRLGANALIAFFPPRPDQHLGPIVAAMQEGQVSRIEVAFCAIFGAPLIEEMFFRGVLYSALARSWSALAAGATSTLFFVLNHVTSLSPYWPALAAVLMFSATAQVLRTKTGSIWPGVALHFAWNCSSFLPSVFHG